MVAVFVTTHKYKIVPRDRDTAHAEKEEGNQEGNNLPTRNMTVNVNFYLLNKH